jgi:hypothetical protein
MQLGQLREGVSERLPIFLRFGPRAAGRMHVNHRGKVGENSREVQGHRPWRGPSLLRCLQGLLCLLLSPPHLRFTPCCRRDRPCSTIAHSMGCSVMCVLRRDSGRACRMRICMLDHLDRAAGR